MSGDLRHGVTDVLRNGAWLTLKTDWMVIPDYQGPLVVRAGPVGHQGQVAYSFDTPRVAGPLVIPPGPTLNGEDGWRYAPSETWLSSPGCYAWQVDGLTFSYVIVFRTGRVFR
jgi:hypothetical protein